MTLEELAKALGIDGEEDKGKFATLKKEFNAKAKEVNKLTETVTKMTEEAEASKEVANKLNAVVTAFGVDLEAKDFDESVENAKENIIKEAGGGATPDEIKELNIFTEIVEGFEHLEQERDVMKDKKPIHNEGTGGGIEIIQEGWNGN